MCEWREPQYHNFFEAKVSYGAGRTQTNVYPVNIKWFFYFVRVAGIEPAYQPWEGRILPLNHTRFTY